MMPPDHPPLSLYYCTAFKRSEYHFLFAAICQLSFVISHRVSVAELKETDRSYFCAQLNFLCPG